MFGFGTRLPVDEKKKVWIDNSFHRLEMILGRDRKLQAEVVQPVDKHFPDTYAKNEQGLQTLLNRVCSFMQVDPASVELALIPDNVERMREHFPRWTEKSSESDPAGLYIHGDFEKHPVVAIRESLATDPMKAVAVIAHELAHVILLGGGLVDREERDMEPLTDLATVYLGLGVFTANAAFHYERHSSSQTQGWSVSKTGYLSEEQFGYALAKFAFERGEHKPEWAKHLASNIRTHFNSAAKWLAQNSAAQPR